MFYVVTVGIYDDYKIMGVFDSKEKAKEAIKDIGNTYRWFVESDYRIEEYPKNKIK